VGKLIMWNLLTLDGFFEGSKSWDLAFHQSVWGDELERLSIEQLGSAERLLFFFTPPQCGLVAPAPAGFSSPATISRMSFAIAPRSSLQNVAFCNSDFRF
jgi:hypothetical protein